MGFRVFLGGSGDFVRCCIGVVFRFIVSFFSGVSSGRRCGFLLRNYKGRAIFFGLVGVVFLFSFFCLFKEKIRKGVKGYEVWNGSLVSCVVSRVIRFFLLIEEIGIGVLCFFCF